MKKNILIAIAAAMLTAGTTVCHAQTQQKPQTEQQQEPVYEQDKVDKRAEFTGGMEKQLQFMMQNLKFPKEAEKAGASGTVRVHFIVEKDGTLTDVKVPDSVPSTPRASAWSRPCRSGSPPNSKARPSARR